MGVLRDTEHALRIPKTGRLGEIRPPTALEVAWAGKVLEGIICRGCIRRSIHAHCPFGASKSRRLYRQGRNANLSLFCPEWGGIVGELLKVRARPVGMGPGSCCARRDYRSLSHSQPRRPNSDRSMPRNLGMAARRRCRRAGDVKLVNRRRINSSAAGLKSGLVIRTSRTSSLAVSLIR